ncbi:MAG: hypothetical protein HC894_13945 [Microcoleus sp. SM1_3_4]|nr:hypothetical protein [Microcoleus sp. SM1_3_4]
MTLQLCLGANDSELLCFCAITLKNRCSKFNISAEAATKKFECKTQGEVLAALTAGIYCPQIFQAKCLFQL